MSTLPILAHLAVAATLALPASSQQTPVVVPQDQRLEGHFHNGPLGEKYLLIEQSLKCDCGCGLDVHSCQFQMQCGTSPVWSARIRRELNDGMTPDAIQAGFVSEFGETVLMAPPAEGFNLVGYLLPSVAIVAAGMLVGLVVRGGAGRGRQPAPVHEISDEEQARLAEELRRLEEAESPDW